MSGEELVLLWRFPPPQEGRDMRTFNVYLELGSTHEPLHLYKFLTITGISESATTFERWNISARRWEIAGEVHWANNFSGQVQFGIHIVSDYLGFQSSRSRLTDSTSPVLRKCVDSRGQTVAAWTQETLELRVAPSAEDILDRLVVTCLIHLWFRAHGYW
ncbi:hypothetical protein A7U60_g8449 [Sanghuangporus baumii]|uniref:Uncharacterized protein n=1 Tax=Sanghuangporus baumii TaxID=108892 RepID=A0A9Q5HR49_SANBA|nr:hypothetical protein A7U60_g8449 [Sanghuangporus baumii]